jgi:hypothetical protein
MIAPVFTDHEIVQKDPEKYIEMECRPSDILKAWSLSSHAHELLDKQGEVLDKSVMNDVTLAKYITACDALKKGEAIAKPVIGIGIMDNLEIGIGREIIAAACVMGIDQILTHVRKAQHNEIRKFF